MFLIDLLSTIFDDDEEVPILFKKDKEIDYSDEVFLTIKKIYSQLFFLQLSKDNKKLRYNFMVFFD